MIGYLALIIPFIWHYGIGAIVLAVAVTLFLLTTFKREAVALGVATAIAAAEQVADTLQESIASRPPVEGRGATEEDIRVLNR